MALFVVGCVTTSENPAEGGFISGVAALSSGAYDRRLEERKATIQEEEARNVQLQSEAASVEKRRTESTSELEDVKSRYEGLQAELDELEQRLAALQAAEQGDRQRLEVLQSDLDRLSEQTTLARVDPLMSAAEKDAQLWELRQRKEQLLRALEEAALQ